MIILKHIMKRKMSDKIMEYTDYPYLTKKEIDNTLFTFGMMNKEQILHYILMIENLNKKLDKKRNKQNA